MRIEIDKSILNGIKEKMLNYLIKENYITTRTEYDFINKKFNSVKHLYVENLKETIGARMQSRSDNIAIDVSFVNLSKDGKRVLGIRDYYYEFVLIELCHELWHNASRGYDSGIVKSVDYLSLNEGITQMLAEDVFGFVVSKYGNNAYKDFTMIAKIIRCSVSNDIVLCSYLEHVDVLDRMCNIYANDNNFYSDFNNKLTNLYILERKIDKSDFSSEYKEAFDRIYKNRMVILYKSLILNIVISKYKSIKLVDKQKEYLNEVLKCLKDDAYIYNIVVSYFNSVINLSSKELENEKEKINSGKFNFEDQREFLELFLYDKSKLNNVIRIRKNGDVFYNIRGKDIKIYNEQVCSLIYLELWFGIANSVNDENLIDFMKRGIKFPSSYSILDKRKWFVGIKHLLGKKGIIVMNTYKEVDNSTFFKFNCLKNDKIPSFDQVREVFNKYKLDVKWNEFNKISYAVIDRTSGKEVKDRNIVKTARFANLWMNSLNIKDDLDKVSNDKKILFDNIMKIMFEEKSKTGDLGVDNILKLYSNNKNYISVIKKIFRRKEYYEWVFEFVHLYCKNNAYQTRKEESLLEKLYGDYYINDDVDMLMKNGNRRK